MPLFCVCFGDNFNLLYLSFRMVLYTLQVQSKYCFSSQIGLKLFRYYMLVRNGSRNCEIKVGALL